jgi:Flp pilus assembly protein TadB
MKKEESIVKNENKEEAEFDRLNARTDERIEEANEKQSHADLIIRQAEEEARKKALKEEKLKAQRKAYSNKSFASVVSLTLLSGAVLWAGMAQMIHPTLWVGASIICLCAACVRFGVWYGRVTK